MDDVEEGSTAIYQADPGVGPIAAHESDRACARFLQHHVFMRPDEAFLGGGLILLLFVATLVLNAYRPRFWCRYRLPVGSAVGRFCMAAVAATKGRRRRPAISAICAASAATGRRACRLAINGSRRNVSAA